MPKKTLKVILLNQWLIDRRKQLISCISKMAWMLQEKESIQTKILVQSKEFLELNL
jgi:hypothetical protein